MSDVRSEPEPGAKPTARHLVIEGRVQGVMYRASAAEVAVRLGLTGWVANRLDGAVEAQVEGPTWAVEEMVAWCNDGPPRAHVERVTVTLVPSTGATRFEVRAHP